MCEFLVRSYRYSSLVSQAWYVFVLFKPFSRFPALADLHSRAWDDIQSSARQNKVVCLSESPESGWWKKGITKVLSQQIYSGILTVDYEGMYLVHEIFLCSREQKARCVGLATHFAQRLLFIAWYRNDSPLLNWYEAGHLNDKSLGEKTWNRRIR